MAGSKISLESYLRRMLKDTPSGADSLEVFKHKSGADYRTSYSDTMRSLYAGLKRNLSSQSVNNTALANKGLQNSGFSAYMKSKLRSGYKSDAIKAEGQRGEDENALINNYRSYIEKHTEKQSGIRNQVAEHLVNTGILNKADAVSYAMGAGLSESDAISVAENVYSINRKKLLDDILKQTASLGLDREGAVMLAKKMGASDEDAEMIGDEVNELLEYYASISEDYLEYLEENSKSTTKTFD